MNMKPGLGLAGLLLASVVLSGCADCNCWGGRRATPSTGMSLPARAVASTPVPVNAGTAAPGSQDRPNQAPFGQPTAAAPASPANITPVAGWSAAPAAATTPPQAAVAPSTTQAPSTPVAVSAPAPSGVSRAPIGSDSTPNLEPPARPAPSTQSRYETRYPQLPAVDAAPGSSR